MNKLNGVYKISCFETLCFQMDFSKLKLQIYLDCESKHQELLRLPIELVWNPFELNVIRLLWHEILILMISLVDIYAFKLFFPFS